MDDSIQNAGSGGVPKKSAPLSRSKLIELQVGFWVKPEDVLGIHALVACPGYPDRVMIRCSDGFGTFIRCKSSAEAQSMASVLAVMVNDSLGK